MQPSANCVVQKCKGKYGGWIDSSWMKGKELQTARLPFCKEHFDKCVSYIHEATIKMQKKEGKNVFWAFVPLQELKKALNS